MSTETIIEPASATAPTLDEATTRFKSGMTRIRQALAAEIEALRSPSAFLGNPNRVTILCMIVAGTRGHLHASGVWRKMTGWGQVLRTLEDQKKFVTTFGTLICPTGTGAWLRALSDEEYKLALYLLDAADEWRARDMATPITVESEVTVPIAAIG